MAKESYIFVGSRECRIWKGRRMKATIPYIEKKFEEFNKQMFAGQLPMLPVELSDAKTFLGVCVYKKRKTKEGKIECYDFKLRINTRMDLPEGKVEDIIIHEMIHYFIGFNKLEDSSSHGPVFKHIMNKINEKFGRNLTISHKASNEEKELLYGTIQRWHVVAVISFKDGKTGIKVLPKNLPRILNYYNTVGKECKVKAIELYMTNNPFFNRFPNSSALYVHYIEKVDAVKNLEGAEKMECDGVRLIGKMAQ